MLFAVGRGRLALVVLFYIQQVATGVAELNIYRRNCMDAIHRVRAIVVIYNVLCHSGADAMNRIPTICCDFWLLAIVLHYTTFE